MRNKEGREPFAMDFLSFPASVLWPVPSSFSKGRTQRNKELKEKEKERGTRKEALRDGLPELSCLGPLACSFFLFKAMTRHTAKIGTNS